MLLCYKVKILLVVVNVPFLIPLLDFKVRFFNGYNDRETLWIYQVIKIFTKILIHNDNRFTMKY
jgi:hypothetical protein